MLNKEEVEIIKSFSTKILNGDKKAEYYDILFNLFRERYVIRWTDEEILKGVKTLPAGKKITLEEALSYKTFVKIDMIFKFGNKFTEMTNVFILIIKKPGDARKYAINFGDYFTGDFKIYYAKKITSVVPADIEKLFYSKYYYNPFKGVKRIWSTARLNKDFRMLNKLKNLISGGISLMYQLKSEIENIITLLKRLRSPPIVGINNSIQDIKSRTIYIPEIYDANDYISELLNNATKATSSFRKLEYLERVKKFFSVHINYSSMNILILLA